MCFQMRQMALYIGKQVQIHRQCVLFQLNDNIQEEHEQIQTISKWSFVKHTIVFKRPKMQTLKNFIATNENPFCERVDCRVHVVVRVSCSRMHRRYDSCTRKHHVRCHNVLIANDPSYYAASIQSNAS